MRVDGSFLQSLGESVVDVNRARSLPPECYVSEEFFEFEKRAIFDHDWICVGHEGQIPNSGDFFTLTLLEEPLIVARGKDAQVRVMRSRFAPRGPYSWQEETLQQFNRWLVKRYRAQAVRESADVDSLVLTP